VTLHQDRESEIFESPNRYPESVVCPDAGCVCNQSGTLQPCVYEDSQFDCFLFIVAKNRVWIVVAPGLQTSCEEPVKKIDWLSPSLRWHVTYIVATSPNPQPCDDVLYKHSV
jgi:hypothetical protein